MQPITNFVYPFKITTEKRMKNFTANSFDFEFKKLLRFYKGDFFNFCSKNSLRLNNFRFDKYIYRSKHIIYRQMLI